MNFEKAGLLRIFFSRLIDIIISSVITFLLAYFINVSSFCTAIILVSSVLLFYLIYFICVPSLFKNRTLGKLIFRTHILYNENFNKINFKILIVREIYFIFIPYIAFSIAQFITAIIYTYFGEDGTFYAQLISKIGMSFYVMWFIYLSITIMIQSNNASAIDIKYGTNIYVIKAEEIKNELDENKNINSPGYIDLEELEKIKNIDYKDVVRKNEK